MTEPLRKSYSSQEATDFAHDWLVQLYGKPRDMEEEERDRFYERAGLIYNLLTDMFPKEIK